MRNDVTFRESIKATGRTGTTYGLVGGISPMFAAPGASYLARETNRAQMAMTKVAGEGHSRPFG